jgi:CBS domain-containing protein
MRGDNQSAVNHLAPIRRLHFETAAEHHSRNVPVAGPDDTVAVVLARLRGKRYASVSEIVVCDAEGCLVGLANIEDVLPSADDVPIAALMDPSPPLRVPAARLVQRAENRPVRLPPRGRWGVAHPRPEHNPRRDGASPPQHERFVVGQVDLRAEHLTLAIEQIA